MIGKINSNHRHEYPIVYFWYTKHKGKTIEEIIDKDVTFFEWAVRTFQDVTPSQAQYYFQKTNQKVPPECIRDVEPYRFEKGDPELKLYMELCETGDLPGTLARYRVNQLDLFS